MCINVLPNNQNFPRSTVHICCCFFMEIACVDLNDFHIMLAYAVHVCMHAKVYEYLTHVCIHVHVHTCVYVLLAPPQVLKLAALGLPPPHIEKPPTPM